MNRSPSELPAEAHALMAELNLCYDAREEYFCNSDNNWAVFVHEPYWSAEKNQCRLRAWTMCRDPTQRDPVWMQGNVKFFPYVPGKTDEAIKEFLRGENFPLDAILRTKRLQALIA